MAFDERGDVRVARPGQQVAFPVARYGSISHLRGPLSDRDSVDNLTTALARRAGVLGPPHPSPTAKVGDQGLLQHAAALHEETEVNRLVRHVKTRIVWKGLFQPARDLLRGPV